MMHFLPYGTEVGDAVTQSYSVVLVTVSYPIAALVGGRHRASRPYHPIRFPTRYLSTDTSIMKAAGEAVYQAKAAGGRTYRVGDRVVAEPLP